MLQIRWFYGLSAAKKTLFFHCINVIGFFIGYALPDEWLVGKEMADAFTAKYCPTVWHHIYYILQINLIMVVISLILFCVLKYRESKA